MIVLDLENVQFSLEKDKVHTTLKKTIPEFLYKYYSLSSPNGQKSLHDGTLFFSHPHHLNDVMDGSFLLWDLDQFSQNYHNETQNQVSPEILRMTFIKSFTENLGVLSLSSNSCNNLMWPHYTEEKGFCLEFNTNKIRHYIDSLSSNEIEIFFFPINYQINLTQISFEKVCSSKKHNNSVTRNANLPILYANSVKDFSWKYEDEWRFLMRNNDFEYIKHKIEFSPKKKTLEEKKDTAKKRCIPIEKNLIEKIILDQLFFSTDRFTINQESVENGERFYFIEIEESNKYRMEILKNFLTTLYENYNDRIYQIDYFIDQNKQIKREVKYKVQIRERTEKYINVKRTRGGFI